MERDEERMVEAMVSRGQNRPGHQYASTFGLLNTEFLNMYSIIDSSTLFYEMSKQTVSGLASTGKMYIYIYISRLAYVTPKAF